MSKLSHNFQSVAKKVEGMSAQQRVMLLVGTLAIHALFFVSLLLVPLNSAKKSYASKVEAEQTTLAQLNESLTSLSKSIGEVNDTKEGKGKSKNESARDNSATPQEKPKSLTKPEEMTRIISQLVAKLPDIEITRLENLPAESLIEIEGTTDTALLDLSSVVGDEKLRGEILDQFASSGKITLYKHGLRVKARGKYKDLIRFTRTMEALPGNIIWGELQLDTVDSPTCEIQVTVYTFSLNETWISV